MTSCPGPRVPLEVIVRVIRLSLPDVAFPSVERNDLLRTYSLVSSEFRTVAQTELFTHVALFSKNQAWRFLRALDRWPRGHVCLSNHQDVDKLQQLYTDPVDQRIFTPLPLPGRDLGMQM
jgi:hypothetical protein